MSSLPVPLAMESLEIRDSAIQGRGVFARVPIAAGTCVSEYVGEKITKDESLKRCQAENQYIFQLDETFDLDGNVEWNPARYINHACDPNCEAQLDEGRIFVFARRNIAPGEELTFNYGYDLADYRDHPCRCGAAECVSYIVAEEFFPDVRRRETPAAAES